MRQSVASIVLFTRKQGDGRAYLAHWNRPWQCFALVGGHKHDDESHRQCAIREAVEELDVNAETQLAVDDAPRARLQYTAHSQSARVQTQYTIEVFDGRLRGDAAEAQALADPRNRWLTIEEIQAGRCEDGKPIGHTVAMILTKVDELPSG